MGIFDHVSTGRGTIFIFRSKFLSYRGRGSPAAQRMNNFLPGKTSYAPQWAFDHVTTRRGTILSSQQIFILLREGSSAGQRMNNFLPGKTSYAPQWAFDHVTYPEGDHFIFAANFYPIEGGLVGGPADEQLFTRQNFLCPAVGLSYPDISLCCTRTPPTARSKNVCQLTTKADSCQ